MTILRMELRGNPDGTAWLNHWDSIGGEDTVLRLSPGGAVHELSYADDDEDENAPIEIWTPVELVARLLELARGDK